MAAYMCACVCLVSMGYMMRLAVSMQAECVACEVILQIVVLMNAAQARTTHEVKARIRQSFIFIPIK